MAASVKASKVDVELTNGTTQTFKDVRYGHHSHGTHIVEPDGTTHDFGHHEIAGFQATKPRKTK